MNHLEKVKNILLKIEESVDRQQKTLKEAAIGKLHPHTVAAMTKTRDHLTSCIDDPSCFDHKTTKQHLSHLNEQLGREKEFQGAKSEYMNKIKKIHDSGAPKKTASKPKEMKEEKKEEPKKMVPKMAAPKKDIKK